MNTYRNVGHYGASSYHIQVTNLAKDVIVVVDHGSLYGNDLKTAGRFFSFARPDALSAHACARRSPYPGPSPTPRPTANARSTLSSPTPATDACPRARPTPFFPNSDGLRREGAQGRQASQAVGTAGGRL